MECNVGWQGHSTTMYSRLLGPHQVENIEVAAAVLGVLSRRLVFAAQAVVSSLLTLCSPPLSLSVQISRAQRPEGRQLIRPSHDGRSSSGAIPDGLLQGLGFQIPLGRRWRACSRLGDCSRPDALVELSFGKVYHMPDNGKGQGRQSLRLQPGKFAGPRSDRKRRDCRGQILHIYYINFLVGKLSFSFPSLFL